MKKRLFSGILSIILVLTSLTWPSESAKASGSTPDYDSMASESISVSSATASDAAARTGDSYDGYILSDEVHTGDYYKVTYTVSGDVTNETQVFNFQPYDTGWGGWDANIVTVGDSTYDSGSGVYTAYIPIADVIASLSSGGTLKGINVSYNQATPSIQITSLSRLTAPEVVIPDYDSMTSDSISLSTATASDAAARTTDKYDGYIASDSVHTGDYYKVVYTVSGDVTDDTEVFNFQPYDTSWGGWDANIVTVGDSTYDNASNTYTVYMPIADVIASLSSGGTLNGINLSYNQATPSIQIVSFSRLTESDYEDGNDDDNDVTVLDTPETFITITQEDLNNAGVNWQGSAKCTVYVHMTDGNSYSALNAAIQLGENASGKSSSKYLVGENNELGKTGNAIQAELVGAAGTANYQFPAVNLNQNTSDGTALSATDLTYFTLNIKAYTSNTDCELLGIVFSNGAKYPTDFSVPTLESTTYDVPEEEDTSYHDKLEYALAFIDAMDSSVYDSDSWDEFQDVVEAARAVLAATTSTETEYYNAHTTLEAAKADLLFVDSDEEGNPADFRILSNEDTVYEMGSGINLGNTMDGHTGLTPTETSWQSITTTKEYIKALHDAGYNTVRIPVTWGTMIDEDNGYAINPNWISRVQDIVDYCVSLDMYAIINVHHDGADNAGWLDLASDEIDDVYYEYGCVWRNIAEYFKDYDEHLIFESLNEVSCMTGDNKNSAEAIEYDTKIIMNLNQIFVNVVRSTGSNNQYRWLTAVAHYANSGTSTEFQLPTDSYNSTNRLMFAAHIYKASTNVTWTYDQVYEVVSGLKKMADKFDVPMYLGEYGTRTYEQAGTDSGYNDVARAYFSEIVSKACQVAGVVPVVWDQGYGDDPYETGLFTFWNRVEDVPIFKTIVDAMMRGTYLPATSANNSYKFTDITEGVTVVEATDITLSDAAVEMTIGDNLTVDATTSPSNSNDVVLWSSDDENVATVIRGIIRARGIGTTTINVYSQSGSVEKTIKVTVKAESTDNDATAITTDLNTYDVVTGKTAKIDAEITPASSTNSLTYKSSNESVVTVNAFGKLVGISEGTAYVTITASCGLTKTVKVIVANSFNTDSAELALNVYYNDATHSYYSNEVGTPISVNGDGQYTVTFNAAEDLSNAAKNAGVTNINKVVSIYIKDNAVTTGDATTSNITAANIRYDSIKVNGQELTIKSDAFKSAIKSSGVFDTNDPINGWDGSAVNEVSATDHVVTFTGITNPTTIEVTFTLEDVAFIETTPVITNGATSIEAVSDDIVIFDNAGDDKKVTVKLNPTDTDSLTSFVTSDASVVAVDNTAMAVNADGQVEVTLHALSDGIATVTAMTDNGLTKEFKIAVGEDYADYYAEQNDIVEDINNAEDGDTVNVEMSDDNTVVKADVIEALKDKDVTLVIDMGNGITWTINGKDITTDTFDDIDLEVLLDSENIPESLIESVAGEKDTLQFSIAYDGELGLNATLKIYVGTEYAGKNATLYYYNPTTDELEEMDEAVVDSNGYVSYDFTHASDYVIVFDEGTGSDTGDDVPPTGDNVNTTAYFNLLLAAAAVGSGCLFANKKRKNRDAE